MSELEKYFSPFRKNTIGSDRTITTPYGTKPLIYLDWTASGRLYRPIEQALSDRFGELVANTHSASTTTGMTMTYAYHEAHRIIKEHVGAGPGDLIITHGSGMTGAVNKLQRILGLRIHERFAKRVRLDFEEKPVVFITHMEHHSNQTSWLETIADVEIIGADEAGLVDTADLELQLSRYADRKFKYGAFTAASNVTGIGTPYHELARIMHAHGGYAFIDFAAAAPYADINMHPADPHEKLDAVMFSPHKFLGGPGSSGVLVFDRALYAGGVPDTVGGGIVDWTNPWGEHKFIDDIETREDAGTPPILQTIKAALAIRLKEEMGTERIRTREKEIKEMVLARLPKIPNVRMMAGHITERLPIFSFYIIGLHYNLVVKLLNDRYGIQTRGGCSCAGTYGHFLLHIDQAHSHEITDKISHGDLSEKPGWVRISYHPTTTDAEIQLSMEAITDIATNGQKYAADYRYDKHSNEFLHTSANIDKDMEEVRALFAIT
ncbi:MAG: aminotransferase class V-fold PLP-dependent enzyme [Bacteroidota bacterium]|nr:aminotransferase class V-fold PLP-dependent enzyme [Bacteroidota bacterium]